MIYHFTGNSHYLVSQQVKAWKNRFIEKYGDFNLVQIQDIQELDNNYISENLCSMSFLAEKKLIIIGLVFGSKDAKINSKIEYFLSLLGNIPENNIVLVYSIEPDKRSKYYKALNKSAQLKEFNSINEDNTFDIIKNNYVGKINDQALRKLIQYKGNNINKVVSEVDKLLIMFDYIELKHILENIYPELEESIFQFIDNILNQDILGAKQKLNIILNDTSIYAFYNNLLANIRTNIYIGKLKALGKSQSEITQLLKLGNRGFLVNKVYRLKYSNLEKLYLKLISLDKKMKSGKMIGTEEKDFQLEFENILVGI